MAERSFKKEVEKLLIGGGETFSGEGILAVTKALLQSGVSYVAGYQGAPISHLMDVLADADDILRSLGVHFESSASEATAAATLAASVNYPLRGAITFKATAGTNVASDPLSNLASGGVTGGALIIVGEDYGEGSSIMQERSHAFAMKSQIWLLDPRPNLPSIVDAVEHGFRLSEASSTPVMLQLRIRACHMHGQFVAKDNVRPTFTLADAMNQPRRDLSRIVLPPSSFAHEKEKVERRWPAAVEYVEKAGLNEFFGDQSAKHGLIVQGGCYNGVIRALQLLGLADASGNTDVPLYVMNVAYPLIDSELRRFALGKEAVLMIEEGQPEFIEQGVNTSLRQADLQARIHGKDMFTRAGEYAPTMMLKGLLKFFERYRPVLEALYLETRERHLSKVNRRFLETLAPLFGVTTPISYSIDYQCEGTKTDRLLGICQAAGATRYVSGPAARVYLQEDRFRAAGIDVAWMSYDGYPEYPQLYPPFEHHVSALDLLLNVGDEAPRYMLSRARATPEVAH